MTSPRLFFESTSHFPPSEIQSVFRFFGKWLVNPNPCVITSPRGEKSGLVFRAPDDEVHEVQLLDYGPRHDERVEIRVTEAARHLIQDSDHLYP